MDSLSEENIKKLKMNLEIVILLTEHEDTILGKTGKKLSQKFYADEFLEEYFFHYPEQDNQNLQVQEEAELNTDTRCLKKILFPLIKQANCAVTIHLHANTVEIELHEVQTFPAIPSTIDRLKSTYNLFDLELSLAMDLCKSFGWKHTPSEQKITIELCQ